MKHRCSIGGTHLTILQIIKYIFFFYFVVWYGILSLNSFANFVQSYELIWLIPLYLLQFLYVKIKYLNIKKKIL